MSMALFDLGEFKETRVEWVPLFKPFGITLASLITGDRCRDCGTHTPSTTQGSVAGVGVFMVCDDCASLDGCTTRGHDRGPEWHVSHWGDSHRAADHDVLIGAQQKRRAKWRARQEREVA